MTKRQSEAPGDLPLFDFPMEGNLAPPAEAESVKAPAPPSASGEKKESDPQTSVDLPLTPPSELAMGEEGASEARAEDRPSGLTAVPDPRPRGQEAAPLGGRVAAGLADLTLQALLLGATLVIVMLMGVRLGLSAWAPVTTLALVFSCLYWIVPLAFWGQTPGMTWAGLLSRAADNQSLTFRQSFWRWIGALLTALLGGLPFLLSLGAKPSLGDRLSRTKTVVIGPKSGFLDSEEP